MTGAIFFTHKDPQIISEKLGSVLKHCSDWLVDNKLSLYLGKTECILFRPRRKLKGIHDFSVTCNGHHIKSTRQSNSIPDALHWDGDRFVLI